MKRLLHILTGPDPFVRQLIEAQRGLPETTVEVVTLDPASPPVVYEELVQRIFVADSIAVS